MNKEGTRWSVAVAVVLVVSGCTRDSADRPLPASLVSPTPAAAADCLLFPIRAERIATSMMLDRLHGHVPYRLPDGFGLLGLYDGGEGTGAPIGAAMWVDASCRRISVQVWEVQDEPIHGPKVGDFVLTHEMASCGSPPGPCLTYRAHLDPGLVQIETAGIPRAEANEIVRSVG